MESNLGLHFDRQSEECAVPAWNRADTIIICALLLVALVTRFWRIAYLPPVFDERLTLSQAGSYLTGDPVFFVHPPLEALLVAATIKCFGEHAISWRLPNALLGILLVAITFLLARRMFCSRLSGAVAAGAVLIDGMFLVHSRLAITNIVYVTFGAWSYLLLFRFIHTSSSPARRQIVIWLAIALGIGLAAKLAIPVVTWVLVAGFLSFVLIRNRDDAGADNARAALVATLALLGATSAIVYLLVFLPEYWFGWWRGIADLVRYHRWALENHLSFPAFHPGASPWWSWPMLLHPFTYWKFQLPAPHSDEVVVVWCGGNPALWWGAVGAVLIKAAQTLQRPSLSRSFLVLGYIGYLVMWIPVRRYLFIYDYLPALYLSYLALAAVITQCWQGIARTWEQVVMLLTLVPSFLLGMETKLGLACIAAIAVAYLVLHARDRTSRLTGRFVCLAVATTAIVLFGYFFSIWTPALISNSSYLARMWLHSPGLLNWE